MSVGTRHTSPNVEVIEAVGEAAAMNIPLNFKPIRVMVINKNTNSIFIWTPPHGVAGHTSIIDSGAGVTDVATATSNGITAAPGGLTLGTGVQTTNDVLYVICDKA